VENGATFHIRIRVEGPAAPCLTAASTGRPLLQAASWYHRQNIWNCRLFLLMPDHLHALLVFPRDRPMDQIIGAWKGYQTKHLGVSWQENFFDHRIRDQRELKEKEAYIRENPVRKGLCARAEDWPWVVACAA
jgi:REP element-mobilizing transposase RayT